MAEITLADVEYVAALAHLELDSATKERMRQDLAEILGYMAQLNELDTSFIEPMMHVFGATNVLREDVVRPSLTQEQALKNAPRTDGEYFLVPRILDGE